MAPLSRRIASVSAIEISSTNMVDEGSEVDISLGLATAAIDPDRPGGDVVVADDQHVRDLLQLGAADPLAERIVSGDDVDAAADRSDARRRPLGVLLVGGRRPAARATCTGASHVGKAPA